jgi:hypothetical protein
MACLILLPPYTDNTVDTPFSVRNIIQIEREKGLQETYLGFPFLVGNVVMDGISI